MRTIYARLKGRKNVDLGTLSVWFKTATYYIVDIRYANNNSDTAKPEYLSTNSIIIIKDPNVASELTKLKLHDKAYEFFFFGYGKPSTY